MCVPLMSASPSFAASAMGRSPARESAGARQPILPQARFALADDDQRQVRQRREIPTRPDRATLGDDGRDVSVEHREQLLDQLDAHARVPAREAVGQEQHRGARGGTSKGSPTPLEWLRMRLCCSSTSWPCGILT